MNVPILLLGVSRGHPSAELISCTLQVRDSGDRVKPSRPYSLPVAGGSKDSWRGQATLTEGPRPTRDLASATELEGQAVMRSVEELEQSGLTALHPPPFSAPARPQVGPDKPGPTNRRLPSCGCPPTPCALAGYGTTPAPGSARSHSSFVNPRHHAADPSASSQRAR